MALLPFDLSALPAPAAIEALDFETLLAAFKANFATYWASARALDPTLPAYTVSALETDPASILGEAWSYLRLLDRARVNDAVKAVLAPTATGANLDNVVARRGVQRLTLQAATDTTAAIMEQDGPLLARYLQSFDLPSAGSADKYSYVVKTAWPLCLDVAVLGFETHGRRGDIDIVLLGPSGRLPTSDEIATVRAAVTAAGVQSEAVSISVMAATRVLYSVSLALTMPPGPDPATVIAAATAAVTAAANARMTVGGRVPMDLISGSAYVPGVLSVARTSPVADIPPEAYTAPVLSGLTISASVAA